MTASTASRRAGRFAAGAALLLTGVLLAPAAWALPPECPTYFPDIRCGRHGRYDGFVRPMMHPYLFEDPFITTGLTGVGIWHEFPGDSILDGGHLWAAALQARIAITDRVAFIATKDGYVIFEPGRSQLDDRQGFADVAFGIKAAVVDMPEIPLIVTPALRFELTTGAHDVLQGNGNGMFIPSISAAWGLDRFHVMGDIGMQLPLDTDDESTSLFYHLHLDYAVADFFVPFVEIGGFYYTDGGDGGNEIRLAGGNYVPIGIVQDLVNEDPEEGYDYANLGSQGIAGHSVVAASVGFQIPIGKHVILGFAYELPISPSRDVLKQRAQGQLTVEF